ncbi:MAG: multidrug transporter [Anaerolineales bacterium]|nr:DMT family transporter [Anaerolineae bacterium]PWB52386.1 MAG: multidrug transporter [Anaerolineales bacterium]
MRTKTITAYIEIIFAVVAWGTSFIATKIVLRDLAPVTVVWVRFAIGLVIIGSAVVARRQFSIPKRNEWPYFILLGFLGITFHQWLQSTALVTVQASTTAWVLATSPIFIAILSVIFLRERLVWLQVFGIILAAMGVLLVVSEGDINKVFSGQFGTPGDILVLVSSVNWAVFSILSSSGLKRYQPTQMMFFVMLIGWILTTVLFIAQGGWADLQHITRTSLLGIAFLGIICSGLAYIAWYDVLHVLPATQVGAFLNIEPLITVLVAWMLLGEQILPIALVGGAIILIGVRLVQKPPPQKM